jgi:hypothetical protein
MSQAILHQLQSGQLAGARALKLSCGLTHLPPEVFGLADTLEVLDLSGNALADLPPDLGRLHRLKVLFASNNAFTHLPESIGQCEQLSMVGFKANRIAHVNAAALPPALRWLILTDNRLTHLPPELGQRTALQKLMLAGNQLTSLPDSIAACESLELLRISANRFATLPEWLLQLPRLSWLAFGGNPMTESLEKAGAKLSTAQAIPWSALTVLEQLGEGASGVIHEADWQGQRVAIKRFKGLMTSDGLPQSEMAACLAAGTHPNLIGVHGSLEHTGLLDDGSNPSGLVMQHIGSGHEPLAGPPSFESCTRDVYAAHRRFSLKAALALAQGIASAAAHLHARGLMHGDLYAHNIMWREAHPALLGDFGAASFLPLSEPARALAQRLDVRALGCLLEELLDRVDADQAALGPLRTVQHQCLQPDVASRPTMAQVAAALQAEGAP